MSALDFGRRLRRVRVMSVLPPKAEVGWASSDVWAAHVWQTRKLYRSSREQDGYLSIFQNVSCCPAKDHLSQSALRVGALNQKVAARRLGCRQDCLAGIFAIKANPHRLGGNPVALQVVDYLFS